MTGNESEGSQLEVAEMGMRLRNEENLRCDWHLGSLTLGPGGSHMKTGAGETLTYETQSHRNFDSGLFDLPI